ncbi:nucleoside-diphosphate kinase [Planctomycetales bacterium ZRK34]|nr:nucleoside-diphosphate kinase [Planctomycetales bacterium ZRK34]
MQTTLIIFKPDAVQRGLMGQLLARFEAKGLQVVGGKFMQVPEAVAKQHYAEHDGKPFFPNLINFITSTPVMVLAIRGREAVTVCRKLIGSTDGAAADPGTIRGDFGNSKAMNLVHGSDSPESAERELKIWFGDGELADYDRTIQSWLDE